MTIDFSSLVLPDLRLRRIKTNKARFFDLLLLADESPAMIEAYLDAGTLYGLFWNKHTPVSLAVLMDVSDDFQAQGSFVAYAPHLQGKRICECKNLVTAPSFRGKGIAAQLLLRLCGMYDQHYDGMLLGTGATPKLRRFYEQKCGFQELFVLKDFFPQHYTRPIIEDGVLLRDKTFFYRSL